MLFFYVSFFLLFRFSALGVSHYAENSYTARSACRSERETSDIRIGRKNIIELEFFFLFSFFPPRQVFLFVVSYYR